VAAENPLDSGALARPSPAKMARQIDGHHRFQAAHAKKSS
jgi:hypothetical protein